jgi:hypothetical protein
MASSSRSSGTKKASPKKAASKKSTSKQAPSKQATSKQATSKQATSKQATSKQATSKQATSKQASPRRSGNSGAPKAEARPAARASQVAAQAASELLELTGKGVEGITGLERTDDGWTVHVEVVEVRRIPDTTDVLALYEVETDKQGSLLGYRRLRRYARGVPGDD